MSAAKAEWVDGECWLCDEAKPVTWIGPLTTMFGTAALFGCNDCLLRLEARVRRQNDDHDNAPPK